MAEGRQRQGYPRPGWQVIVVGWPEWTLRRRFPLAFALLDGWSDD